MVMHPVVGVARGGGSAGGGGGGGLVVDCPPRRGGQLSEHRRAGVRRRRVEQHRHLRRDARLDAEGAGRRRAARRAHVHVGQPRPLCRVAESVRRRGDRDAALGERHAPCRHDDGPRVVAGESEVGGGDGDGGAGDADLAQPQGWRGEGEGPPPKRHGEGEAGGVEQGGDVDLDALEGGGGHLAPGVDLAQGGRHAAKLEDGALLEGERAEQAEQRRSVEREETAR
mmetsp:Transcript_49738/g.166180  ORF Transcript_49738/g.166180 Transcript_49738/m.166180 type:complete len:226 (-) Transcript_49738:290-967(-)